MGFTDELCSLQPGMTVGDLHIASFVGKGAIGEVYQAVHDTSGQEFAVKVIPKGFTAEAATAAFDKVKQVQGTLNHPQIVKIDELGEEDMFYWMRMEYVPGEIASDGSVARTLEDLMRKHLGVFTEEEVCYYVYYLLLGLEFAHSNGVVHGDLKPANIMIADEGVKISELGITDLIGHAWDDFHLLRQNPRLDPTPFDPLPGFSRCLPALLNTFEYFSPEQKMGQQPTALSNLYTVGVIVYRMLTGRGSLSPELPSQVIEGLNPAWDAWLAQAIAYEPDRRFTSAVQMLQSMPGLESE